MDRRIRRHLVKMMKNISEPMVILGYFLICLIIVITSN